MRLRHDFAIGVVSVGLSMAVNLAVVPVYVRILGIESYGLVGFLALLQGVLQMLDLGLSPTVSREVARARALADIEPARALLQTLGVIYWCSGFAIGGSIAFLARPIAVEWLAPDRLSVAAVAASVAVMGAVIACRWPVGIYSGVMIGAHRLALVSITNLFFTFASTVGGVVVLVTVRPTIETLMFWYSAVSLLQLLTFRWLAWREIGGSQGLGFSFAPLRSVWKFSAGMAGVAVAAVILSQLDKIIVSKLVSLESFGYYMLATVGGRALYGVINPLYNIIYPRFSAYVAAGQEDELRHAYRFWTAAFCTLFFPASMALIIGAEPVVAIWTGNEVITAKVAPLVALICLGSAFHSIMYFPYALQVAYGSSRLPLIINMMLILIYIPLALSLTLSFDLMGAALAWLILFIAYVAVGTWLTRRYFLPDLHFPWLFKDVGFAALTSTAFGVVGHLVLSAVDASQILQIFIIFSSAICALLTGTIVLAYRYPEVRSELRVVLHSLRLNTKSAA